MLSHLSVATTLQQMLILARESERETALGLGLNLTDFRALSVLTQSGPMTSGNLALELGSTAATTTAITNRLELGGYLTRNRGAADRRHVMLTATNTAFQGILDPTHPLATALYEQLQGLPVEHSTIVSNFLDATQVLMRNHLHTLSNEDTP
ncbi:MAG: MarR family transcriptional regulator [Arthrobacter sp.]|uniref:MarR family transcriptional regulator n=1 Tax=unclassified Arthrobacter TaxID=235627 RepID=UPI00264EF2D4|nr:MarR family transcriptional regulator [Micrococcaceae bacterium]MDN5823873.1 MarR family transcriptional regulator [Micrococcaceae bacterium]MDN5878535.1 MarR family transcriptional regulator [Micrococcaceae bacterium]MDN5886376.1 MarR family transcriptional regulator [Micrococcaceae bacterium]MDN5905997.1 MarR family transcriptional regulator [Micrococcaceae bacterium]